MSFIHEKLAAIKEAIHKALELADPEFALKEAEQAFKQAVADEVVNLRDDFEAFKERFDQPPSAPSPVTDAASVSAAGESPSTTPIYSASVATSDSAAPSVVAVDTSSASSASPSVSPSIPAPSVTADASPAPAPVAEAAPAVDTPAAVTGA